MHMLELYLELFFLFSIKYTWLELVFVQYQVESNRPGLYRVPIFWL